MLQYPGKNGSLQAQLECITRLGKQPPSMLNGVPVPTLSALNTYESWIKNQWDEISRSRQWIEGQPQPITDTMIKDYMVVMEEDLRYIDKILIKDMDKSYVDEISNQQLLNKD